MKKIIFFSKNLNIGGMEIALINLLNKLADNYDITLVLEEKIGTLINNLDNRVNVQEYSISKNSNPIIRKPINFIKRLKWSIINNNKYDFSCNYATYSLIGSRLAQIASKNSSLYVHSDYYNCLSKDKNQVINFFKSHNLKDFKNIIFVSNESVKNLSGLFPSEEKKFSVINNIIDYKRIENLASEDTDVIFKKDNINLLFIGRLDNTSKNFSLLIDAFKRAKLINDKLHLTIVGDGLYRNEIEKMIKLKGIINDVTLTGEKKNPYPYIAACDSLVFTSYYEGFPVTYFEALKLNAKVVTTVPVSDSYIDVRKYFTIVPMDVEEIAKVLSKINKKQIDYNINLEELNRKNLEKFLKIVEEEW